MTLERDLTVDNHEELVHSLANIFCAHLRLELYEKYNQTAQNHICHLFAYHLHTSIPRYLTTYFISELDEDNRPIKQFHEGPGVQYNSRRNGDLVAFESIALPESLFSNPDELYKQLKSVIHATNELLQFPQEFWRISANRHTFFNTLPKELLKMAIDYYASQDSAALLSERDQNPWRCILLQKFDCIFTYRLMVNENWGDVSPQFLITFSNHQYYYIAAAAEHNFRHSF